jgi:hypothetical protein
MYFNSPYWQSDVHSHFVISVKAKSKLHVSLLLNVSHCEYQKYIEEKDRHTMGENTKGAGDPSGVFVELRKRLQSGLLFLR